MLSVIGISKTAISIMITALSDVSRNYWNFKRSSTAGFKVVMRLTKTNLSRSASYSFRDIVTAIDLC